MGTTLDLQNELKELLGSDNVYFQPPTNLRMNYPCIVMERGSGHQLDADNRTYIFTKRYVITHIGYDPDEEMVDKLVHHFKMCKYDRHFVSDNLQHDVFTLYW